MLQFEVGKTYIVYAKNSSAHFRAKCVSRTAKTATFVASERGGWWYMPEFTLRRQQKEHYVTPEGEEEEVMVSNKGGRNGYQGVFAFAGTEATTPLP